MCDKVKLDLKFSSLRAQFKETLNLQPLRVVRFNILVAINIGLDLD